MTRADEHLGDEARDVREWQCGKCETIAFGASPPDECSRCGARGRDIRRIAPNP